MAEATELMAGALPVDARDVLDPNSLLKIKTVLAKMRRDVKALLLLHLTPLPAESSGSKQRWNVRRIWNFALKRDLITMLQFLGVGSDGDTYATLLSY
jgi:hypothetical protein